MELTDVPPLDEKELEKWIEVTQVQLVDEIKTSINPAVIMVNVSVVSQNPSFEKSRRGLRQLQKNHEIVFNADYEIQVAQEINNIDVFVTGAFVSDFKRKLYMERLKTIGGQAFVNVSEVVVESLTNPGDGTDDDDVDSEQPEDGNTDTPAEGETSPAGGGIGIGIVVGIVHAPYCGLDSWICMLCTMQEKRAEKEEDTSSKGSDGS